MGKLKSTTAWFIADANVLIDYAKTSPAILGLVAQHVGPVYVAADVLEEVEQLDEAQCLALGLQLVEGNLAQLTEAAQRGGPLSFEDKLCLVLARDNGWACLSNDGPLRDACKAQGVPVVWGLEIMLALVEGKHLTAAAAIQAAQAIHAVNPMFIHHGQGPCSIPEEGCGEETQKLIRSKPNRHPFPPILRHIK